MTTRKAKATAKAKVRAEATVEAEATTGTEVEAVGCRRAEGRDGWKNVCRKRILLSRSSSGGRKSGKETRNRMNTGDKEGTSFPKRDCGIEEKRKSEMKGDLRYRFVHVLLSEPQ